MSLISGEHVGPYEVIAPIGAGGMGEVYRGRDTRLGRDVAIKVLPADVAQNPDRLRRFEQEARAAGALNHPNVLVVHDVGTHNGAPYLVSELLEGTTLREQMRGTPLATSRAIQYGMEIARGLAAAHARGIVHRDLKPDNVFITRDGRAKLLDFGIAKLSVLSEATPASTITLPGTEPGILVGTIGYMSPEQIRGRPVDARSDLFCLGLVLFEMLAGRSPFSRDSRTLSLNAVLSEDVPELATLNPTVPAALDQIVRHCLEKEPERRFQSASDVAFALETTTPSSVTTPAPALRRRGGRRLAGWMTGLLAVSGVIAGVLIAPSVRRTPAAARPLLRFEVPAPADGAFQGILGISSAISPDGTRLVMSVTTADGPQLFLRSLDSPVARPIPGTERGLSPFWSPDSRQIGFFADGTLKRVAVAGGAPQTVCDAAGGPWLMGAWGPDDVMLLAGAAGYSGIAQVSAAGGRPRLVAPSADGTLSWPSFLPDGRHFLVYKLTSNITGEVRVGSLGSSETSLLLTVHSRAVYADPGYLLFVRDGSLMAQRFDTTSLALSGTPQAIADDLLYFRDLGQADFSASTTGIVAYQAGSTDSRLVWYRRDGSEIGPLGDPAPYFFPRLSRDGRRIVVDIMDRRSGVTDVWLFDLDRGGPPSNVTVDAAIDWTPVLSPDGANVAFASSGGGAPNLHVKRLASPGGARSLVPPGGTLQFVTDWVDGPAGQFIVFNGSSPATGIDLMAVSPDGSGNPRPLVQTSADDTEGVVSPDGAWIAYVSTETGRNEVYVRALKGSPDRWPVSAGGGVSPRWRRDGRELFYLATRSTLAFGAAIPDGRIMAVPTSMDHGFHAGTPTPLFAVRSLGSHFDVAGDGQRFLVNAGGGSAALPITVTVNWTDQLH